MLLISPIDYCDTSPKSPTIEFLERVFVNKPNISSLAPRCLSRAEAAAYVGVCVDVFDDEVRAGLWPAGRPRGAKGGKLTWDRKALDAAEDLRSGFAVNPSAANPIRQSAAEALEARLRAKVEAVRAQGGAQAPRKR
jgi:hypothetical protein